METHYHFTAVTAVATVLLVFVVFGTAHLLALPHDNRVSRALIALGF